MTDVDVTDRLEARASDGSRLVFTRDARGRVHLAVGQCPDRVVSVRLPGPVWERVRAWGGGDVPTHRKIHGDATFMRMQNAIEAALIEEGHGDLPDFNDVIYVAALAALSPAAVPAGLDVDRTMASKVRKSGKACANCGTTYAECTRTLLEDGSVCCRRCVTVELHDERDEAALPAEPGIDWKDAYEGVVGRAARAQYLEASTVPRARWRRCSPRCTKGKEVAFRRP